MALQWLSSLSWGLLGTEQQTIKTPHFVVMIATKLLQARLQDVSHFCLQRVNGKIILYTCSPYASVHRNASCCCSVLSINSSTAPFCLSMAQKYPKSSEHRSAQMTTNILAVLHHYPLTITINELSQCLLLWWCYCHCRGSMSPRLIPWCFNYLYDEIKCSNHLLAEHLPWIVHSGDSRTCMVGQQWYCQAADEGALLGDIMGMLLWYHGPVSSLRFDLKCMHLYLW